MVSFWASQSSDTVWKYMPQAWRQEAETTAMARNQCHQGFSDSQHIWAEWQMLHKSLAKSSKLLGMPSLPVQILLSLKAEFNTPAPSSWKPPLVILHPVSPPLGTPSHIYCWALTGHAKRSAIARFLSSKYTSCSWKDFQRVLFYLPFHLALGSHGISNCGLNV